MNKIWVIYLIVSVTVLTWLIVGDVIDCVTRFWLGEPRRKLKK